MKELKQYGLIAEEFITDVGTGIRTKLTIDCSKFEENNDVIYSFIEDIINEFKTSKISIFLENLKETEFETFSIDDLIQELIIAYNIKDIWIYIQHDFIKLLTTDFLEYIKNPYVTFITGEFINEYKEYVNVNTAPVTVIKPTYRQSFNQQIWQPKLVNKDVDPKYILYANTRYMNVTKKLDQFQEFWEKQIKIK